MRIVVHGQQAFGKSVLEALLERGENVVGVYCAPEPAQGGGRIDPLKEAALARGLPVHQPRSFRNKPEVRGGIRAAQGGSLRHGLRHAHRARGGAQSPHAGHHPVPSLAAPPPSRPQLHQLADHHGGDAHRADHLLARSGPGYGADLAAEGRRDPGHRHPGQPLLRSAVSARRRGAAGGRGSGARGHGAEDRSGRVPGDVRRVVQEGTRPDRLAEAPPGDLEPHPRSGSPAGGVDHARGDDACSSSTPRSSRAPRPGGRGK